MGDPVWLGDGPRGASQGRVRRTRGAARGLAFPPPTTLGTTTDATTGRIAIAPLRFPPPPLGRLPAARRAAIPRLRPHRRKPLLAILQQTPSRTRPAPPISILRWTRISSIVGWAHGRVTSSTAGQVSEERANSSSEAPFNVRRRCPPQALTLPNLAREDLASMVHAADVTRRRGPATYRPNGPNLNRPQQPSAETVPQPVSSWPPP